MIFSGKAHQNFGKVRNPQKLSVVSGAISSRARVPAAGLKFLDFLSTPYARQALQDSGLDLPKQR